MPRTVADTIPAMRATEGGGVTIRRAFPTPRLEDLDPFLLLDHLGPIRYAPGESTGFPDHPHRGFETVTYLLEGQMQHRDSFDNAGLLEAGDVQWMTAGSGLVHSEMPGPDLVRTGGTLHGFQLWVNLPRAGKMAAPRYQELKADRIPVARAPGVVARVIAGEAMGTRGAVETHTPILYLHAILEPGARFEQPVPATWNAFVYHVSGSREGKLDVYAHDAGELLVTNKTGETAQVLVIAGRPLGEPVARYGPFAMNTREEIYQAVEDFRSGKMGAITRT